MKTGRSHRDKIVVVTGAGSGIGRATALAFAARGARVAACDVDEARLQSLESELGDRALLVSKIDVADRAQMASFAAGVHDRGFVDVLVNNAGVAVGGNFLDTSLDDWDWLLGINLNGVVHGCHFFIPPMVQRGAGGHVINVSSILGIYPAPKVTAYVASKFAVLGFSQSLRAELEEHKIGVTAICPGMIATQIVADGRMQGDITGRRSTMVDRFRKTGAPPSLVADVILDAVRTNPVMKTVGRDARVIHALTQIAPQVTRRLGTALSRRFGTRD